MMPIIAVFQGQGLSQENYEAICRKLTGGKKSRMESPSDWPVEGILAHAAGQGPDGFRVVDVWSSEDTFRRFGEALIPLMNELGIQGAPEVYPAHAYVSAK
jgi:hypothetical protein